MGGCEKAQQIMLSVWMERQQENEENWNEEIKKETIAELYTIIYNLV